MPTKLDSLLASPTVAPLISAVPALATLAAEARRELAAAVAAAARPAPSAGTASPAGAAIIPAEWTPTIPSTDPAYAMPPAMLRAICAALAGGGAARFTGPAGTGKTEAAAVAAAHLRRPLFTVDAAGVRDPSEWIGCATLSGGRVAWQDSQMVAALNTPGAIILIDEANRSATAAQNGLLAMMDSRRALAIPQRAEPVRVAEGVSFVLTTNEGAEYAGTSPLDLALVDRCTVVEFGYLDTAAEANTLAARFPSIPSRFLSALVEIATSTRCDNWRTETNAAAISTRALILTARQYAALIAAEVAESEAAEIAVRCLASRYAEDGGNESPRARILARALALRIVK